MSAQLDRIEVMLRDLCTHLGLYTHYKPEPEDEKAIEKYAEEHKKAALRAVEKLFDENTDELTDLGQKVVKDAWMSDGVTPK